MASLHLFYPFKQLVIRVYQRNIRLNIDFTLKNTKIFGIIYKSVELIYVIISLLIYVFIIFNF